MKDSRRSSSTYTADLFLHVVKHNVHFLFFLLYGFLSRIFTIHMTAEEEGAGGGGEGGYLLISFLPLPPASQSLRHQLGYCWRELTSAHSWQPESNMEPFDTRFLEFTLSSLALASAVVWRMLITRVTLGNISLIKSN